MKYHICKGNTLRDLESEVNKYLDSGWKLHFAVQEVGSFFVQVVVMEDEDDIVPQVLPLPWIQPKPLTPSPKKWVPPYSPYEPYGPTWIPPYTEPSNPYPWYTEPTYPKIWCDATVYTTNATAEDWNKKIA